MTWIILHIEGTTYFKDNNIIMEIVAPPPKNIGSKII